MITWGEIIDITLDMFPDANQTKLAELLNIDKSTLSRIKNGKRNFRFGNEVFYNKVFNPDDSQSLAHDDPAYHLELLKEIIEGPKYVEVKKVMDDCWDEKDYKTFIMRLLSRTRNKTPDDGADVLKEVHTRSPEIAPPRAESSTAVSDMGKRSRQSLLLPHRDKCCFYCIHWSGNTETFGAYMNAAYGRCQKYNRDHQMSSAAACADYKANLIVIDQMRFCGVNTEGLI